MSLFGKKDSGEVAVASDSKPRGKSGKRAYGIAEATLLMRSLPVDQNVELVVRVVRNTLESMNVQLPEIIEDAVEKEKILQSRKETLNGEIAEFTKQIDQRRQEIARLEEELSETTTVKERLSLAQQLAGKPVTAHPAPNPTKEGASAKESASPPPLPLRMPTKPVLEAR
jgi:vacuolar-type H+-ATPase subunit I/STV1